MIIYLEEFFFLGLTAAFCAGVQSLCKVIFLGTCAAE
jgi:hypothetical protein